jgi:cytochrome b561/polyisoprenoid-binding protein YceI
VGNQLLTMTDGATERYGRTAVTLHWLTAALIVCGFTLGLSMVGLPLSRRKLQWYAWHKWIGITVFLLTCARLTWRLGHPAPPPAPMPAWQQRASMVSHVLLYLFLLVIPVSGWLYSSATGVQVVYLGLIPLPDLVARDRRCAQSRPRDIELHPPCAGLCAYGGGVEAPLHRPGRGPLPDAAAYNEERLTMALLRSFIPSLGMMLLAATQAAAQGVLIDKSEIRFVSRQMGVNVEGRFRRWKANIVFLPKELAKSKADFDIELASIDLASDESETEIKRPKWFDTAKYPVAKFVSTNIKDLGGDKYEVAGALTIKGISHDAVVPIVLKKDAAGNSVAEGSFAIKRLDYKVGEAEWADTETVANDVTVRIRMVLPPIK